MTKTNRRKVLKWGSAAGIAGGFFGSSQFTYGEKSVETPSVKTYKKLGRTGMEISDISFGSSRLRSGEENLVRHALDSGINYFDTAHSYTGGQSETVIGNVIKDKRDKVFLVSKSETRANWSTERIMGQLDESLERLQTDYVDVYMNHAVNDVKRMQSEEWQNFAEKAKKAGKIRFVGMSGHAGRLNDCLEYSLDEDMVDVILVAYNFGQDPSFVGNMTRGMNFVALQPDLPRLLKKAKDNDVGTVVMKTLSGARLNDMRPFETEGGTFAQAAFRWVLSDPSVDALVVSMTTKELINEYLDASGDDEVSHYDKQLLQQYLVLNSATQCRPGCNDCASSCPHDVQISDVLRTRMYATDYQDVEMARDSYARLAVDGSACISCSGEPCRNACTYGVAISKLCAPTHRMLA